MVPRASPDIGTFTDADAILPLIGTYLSLNQRQRHLEILNELLSLPLTFDIPADPKDYSDPYRFIAFLERRIFSPGKNVLGAVYTPLPVVDYLLSRISPHVLGCEPTLDPSCGCGVFLLRAFQKKMEISREDPSPRRIVSSLYGIDTDPRAVLISQVLLFSEIPDPTPEDWRRLTENILCGNSLIEPSDLAPGENIDCSPVIWSDPFHSRFQEGGFPLIIGNPPYGLSRGDQLSPLENVILKRIYARTRSGKLNKYIAFMARSWSLLAPDGVLSLIVPNAWLGIEGGRQIRRLFLEEGELEEVSYFAEPVFQDPSVEAVLFVARRAPRKTDTINIFRVVKSAPTLQAQVPISRCLKNVGLQIPLLWSDEIEGIISKIESSAFPLGGSGSGFSPLISLQAYAEGKGSPPQSAAVVKEHPFHARERRDESFLPYYQGKDISRYTTQWSGDFLSYGPWLAEPQKLERFSGHRIVVREILGAPPYLLKATLLDTPALYNKSVLNIVPATETSRVKTLALLVILNSSTVSFLIKLLGRKSQRSLFPKVVNDDLKYLLVPGLDDSLINSLAPIAEALLAEPYNAELNTHADRLVAQSYGLSPEDYHVIQKTVMS